MKLKYREIAEYRAERLIQQEHCCALCGEPVIDDAVLDHCHKTGLLRQVLHRGCNALLGKIENNMPRNRITLNRLNGIANNLVNYLTTQHTDLIHPTHKDKTMKSLPMRGSRTKKNRDKRPKK